MPPTKDYFDAREPAVAPVPILRLVPEPRLPRVISSVDVAQELRLEKARALHAIQQEMHRVALLYGREEALKQAKDALYLEFGAEALGL